MALHPYNALWQFQSSFGQPHSVVPGLPSVARRELRKNLLAEEYQEYLDGERANDLTAIGDALIDMVYIIYGTGIEYGLPMGELFDEVHRSNMTKIDPVTGRVIRREDGKILKPASYSSPNLAGIIERRLAAVEHLYQDGTDPTDVLAPEMPSASPNPLTIMDDFFFGQTDEQKAEKPLTAEDIKRIVTEAIDEVIDEAIDEAGEGYDCPEETVVTFEGPPERFAVFVSIPAGTRPDVAKKLVAEFKNDFMNDVADQGDEALYYFLPTTGKPKIVRL